MGERRKLHCELVPLDRVYELASNLASEIRAGGFAPELVVAVARGGFVPARLVCDFLGVHDLASLGIRHYQAGARAEPAARVAHPLGADPSGRRVLVVDDVNDSGDTLAAARAHLEGLAPAELRFAVLHEKPSTHVRADFRAEEVHRWHWLIYAWALVEDAVGFLEQMEPRPASAEEALARLDEDFGLLLTHAQWRRVRTFMPASTLGAEPGEPDLENS